MGLPNIIINFKEIGIQAIKRGQRGVVALVLKDTVAGVHDVLTITDIPADLSDENKKQIELALLGYTKPPKKVIVVVIAADSEGYSEGLVQLELLKFDYLAIPFIDAVEASSVAIWIKSQYDNMGKKVKAVLPKVKGDHPAIINFTSDNIVTADATYTTAEYCSRIAGLIAGTPITISCTFAPLPEVLDFDRLSKDAMDEAVDGGEMILYHDGEKVKVARGVNSLVTTTEDQGESFKKIKIIEAMNMIFDDVKKTAEDNYLGKYSNSYDNKCLLITAIQGYIDQLIIDGVLDKAFDNKVFVDIPQQTAYLKSVGVDVENMSEQEIKEANTKDKVFLASNIKILDAIEEVTLNFTI